MAPPVGPNLYLYSGYYCARQVLFDPRLQWLNSILKGDRGEGKTTRSWFLQMVILDGTSEAAVTVTKVTCLATRGGTELLNS